MDQKERMLAGLPYKAWLDGLREERAANKARVRAFNDCDPADAAELDRLVRAILGKCGTSVHIEQPFRCDYGRNIEVGENFYANFGCVILDVGRVVIGRDVMFAPGVSIYTAGHPVHPDSRRSGYEYGIAVEIGDDVWIGGNAIVNPGVRIGSGAVIGSGSVVTRDVPDGAIAAGNPCRVLRFVGEEDRHFYFKDRRFDVDDYLP